MPLFLLYNKNMTINGEKLGAFIIPTGIGAAIGGYAGDAGAIARKFAMNSKLIVNPNVVNAGCFSAITDNMLYVEGYSLNEFFKGNINLEPVKENKIGIIFDKAIPQDVLNIHINTINAVKCVYGIDISGYEVTDEEVGIEFFINNQGISTGNVLNNATLLRTAQKLIQQGADALAVVCMFDNPEDDNPNYANGMGVDPVGGVEAVISHYISKVFRVPCAHSPAFSDYTITSQLVSPGSAAEYITPTFLPCILLGLRHAPKLVPDGHISAENPDYLIMPYNSLGAVPVFEALKRNITVFAVKENTTSLNVVPEKISSKIRVVDSYEQCLEIIENHLSFKR